MTISLNRILSLCINILFIILFIFICSLNILPNKYLIIILVILSVIGLSQTLINFKIKSTTGRLIFIVLDILVIIGSIIGIRYVKTTNNFFNSLSEVSETSYYYVLVNKSSEYNNISDLKSKTIGSLNIDSESYENSKTLLKKKIDINIKEFFNVDDLIKDIIDLKIDSIFINSNIYDIICENSDIFKDNTKIIETIEVEIKKEEVKEDDKKVTHNSFSILISGIDTNGPIKKVSRSDVNIVLTVNVDNHEVLLTSIPRDYYVQLHGTKGNKDKLTHAGIYGINMSMKTIEDLLNTDIKYYIRVNFDTVIKLVDEIDGIEVYSDKAFTAYNGKKFKKGMNHLDGESALAFARERKKFKGGDRVRGEHQMDIIEAIIDKVSSTPVFLTNYNKIMKKLSNSFQTSIPDTKIKEIIKDQLDFMYDWRVKSFSLNGSDSSNYTYSMPGRKLYVMVPNKETVNKASKYINEMLSGKTIKEIGIK